MQPDSAVCIADKVHELPPELGLETVQNLGNVRLEFLKRFYDRTPIVERYMHGELSVHLHGVTDARLVCLTYMCDESHSSQRAVLVGVGQVLERLHPIPSIVRLQRLDHYLVFDRKSFKEGWNAPLPFLYGVFNRKLRAFLRHTRVKNGQFIHKIIQGCPQVVDAFPNADAKNRWETCYVVTDSMVKDSDALLIFPPRFYRTIEGHEFTFEPRQVGLCPPYSGIGILKRWLHGIDLKRLGDYPV